MFSSRYIGLAFAVVIAAVSLSLAQVPTPDVVNEGLYTAPIVWTQYKIPNQNLSVAMPKLPVVKALDDLCSQTTGASYSAYADEAVYEFIWHAKSEQPYPKGCESRQPFGMKQFLARLDSIRSSSGVVESDVKVMASPAKMFRIDSGAFVKSTWMLWDIDRWFEMSVIRRKNAGSNEERFVSSLSLADDKAVEIVIGSSRIIGDKLAEATKAADSSGADSIESVVIISKPSPGYNDIARRSGTKGTVILDVTFLANGSIGPITVDKSLINGLTEQTIAAVQKITFLPQRKNGVPETVTKKLEYIFSIY